MTHESDATKPVTMPDYAAYGSVPQTTKPLEIVARLVCVGGPDLGMAFRLDGRSSTIGRGDVQIRLNTHDVSRNHARIWLEADGYCVEDLGATNPTLVNDRPIAGPTPLRYGDRLQLGTSILVLTHHDELQTRFQQLQRLDAITAAVSGMAHDFNNALTVIVAALDELGEELPADANTSRALIADMEVAANAAVSLAKRLVKLGRHGPVPDETVEVGKLVTEVVAMVRRVIGVQRIVVTSEVAPGLRIRGSADELQQVLLNLCINARDAMPDGGTIRVEARLVPLDRTSAIARLLPSNGTYVDLSVRDTGTGMDEATLARIFEPFFTTKEPGKGTGLGLAMTHVIVKKHGGTVLVESKLGAGTTFRVLVPARL
jgi:signal transduction histidine kinase